MFRRTIEALGLTAAMLGSAQAKEVNNPPAPQAEVTTSASTVQPEAFAQKEVEVSLHADQTPAETLLLNTVEDKRKLKMEAATDLPDVNELIQKAESVSEIEPLGDVQVKIELAKDLAIKLAANTDTENPGGGVMGTLKF